MVPDIHRPAIFWVGSQDHPSNQGINADDTIMATEQVAYQQLKAMPAARTRQILLDARRFAGLMSRPPGQDRNPQAGRSS
jgi:hypothetical protein